MAIEKMSVAKISGTLDMLDRTLDEICAAGVFQPENAESFYSAGMGLKPFDGENTAGSKISELETLAKNAGIKLHVREHDASGGDTGEDEAFFGELSEKLKNYAEEKKALSEQIELCKNAVSNYSHFKDLEVDLGEIGDCRYVKPRFGHMPRAAYERIAEYAKDHPYIRFFPCSMDGDECWGVYFAPKEKLSEVDGVFASLFFQKIFRSDVSGTVADLIAGLQNNIELVTKQIEELDERAKKLCQDEEQHMNLYYSKLCYDSAKYEMRAMAYHNKEYFFLAGWVPQKNASAFEKRLEKLGGNVTAEITEPDETLKVKPPVRVTGFAKILRFFVAPYTFYVDMYGTPSYNDLDVTAFVAITYTILFGMMFGDMGQGLVLAIAGALMWKLKHMALGKILVPCGMSSMVFGFVFGSVFGYEHLLDQVYAALGWSGKPIEVFENVNLVLLIAIAIGVGLVMCAIVLNIIGCIKRKCFGEALLSQNGLCGLILYACGANLASAFMGGPVPFDSGACGIVIGVCAVILIIKEPFIEGIDHHHFAKPESMMDFLLQNVFEFVEYILSYMSNTVSFLRVGAFVLVHAGMMMVVFSLAGANENIVVIVLGNILVIALEGLLTGIQALRLEYYEMFSRFYIGDGRKFTPVRVKKSEKN